MAKKFIHELTEQDAKNFIVFLISKGLENSTINCYLKNAKGSVNSLEEEGIWKNIFRMIKYLKKKPL